MIGMHRFDPSRLTSHAVVKEPHGTICVDRSDNKYGIFVHKSLDALKKEARIIQVFYYLSRDYDIKGVIQIKLIKPFQVSQHNLFCSESDESVNAGLIGIQPPKVGCDLFQIEVQQ